MATTQTYLDLIASQHQDKPKFMALVELLVQPYVDNSNLLASLPTLFDIDVAVGNQLDIVGQWIGLSRYLQVALPNVYFSFDTAGLGFDQGTWLGPNDPTTGLTELPDDSYRSLLYSEIARNQWNGSVEDLVSIWNSFFAAYGITLAVQDYGDMTFLLGILSTTGLNAVTKALLSTKQIELKPEAVALRGYVIPSVDATPFFGFDVQNTTIAGFDTGSWAQPL